MSCNDKVEGVATWAPSCTCTLDGLLRPASAKWLEMSGPSQFLWQDMQLELSCFIFLDLLFDLNLYVLLGSVKPPSKILKLTHQSLLQPLPYVKFQDRKGNLQIVAVL